MAEYTHLDHQGTPVASSDAAGNQGWREHYTPFGEKWQSDQANDNDIGYTGHVQDFATGLTYMQARYYDPVIGRFLSTDPIGYQDQMNLYAYVANDPVNMVDPDGRQAAPFPENAINAIGFDPGDPQVGQRAELSRNMPAHRTAAAIVGGFGAAAAVPALSSGAGLSGTAAAMANMAAQGGVLSGTATLVTGGTAGEAATAAAGGALTGGGASKVGTVMKSAPRFAQALVGLVGGTGTTLAADSVDGTMNSSAGDSALSGGITAITAALPGPPVTISSIGHALDAAIEVEEPKTDEPREN